MPASLLSSQALQAQPSGQAPQASQGALPSPNTQPTNVAMPTPYMSTSQSVLDRVAPLTPKEIVKLRTEIEQRRDAFTQNVTGHAPAKPTSTQTTIDLSPGGTPPVVRIAPHQGATIMFVDVAGRPWPVEAADNFNDSGYDVKQMAKHVFSVGMKQPEIGNIAFKLKDIARPVMVTVMPAQGSTDYNLDLVVPKFLGGVPPAALASADPAPSHMSDALMPYLYRTPPRSALRLNVGGAGDVMAWQVTPTSMVVRTSAMVLSPAWSRRQGSSDGVFVYELPLTPVVVISRDGTMQNISLSGIRVDPTSNNATSVADAQMNNAGIEGASK